MKVVSENVKMVALDKLEICMAYQRTICKSHVNKIAKSFNNDAFGHLCVGKRKDGSLWVVDGQHRMKAAQKIGLTHILCDIFESDGQEHEAKVFRDKNATRKLSAVVLFKTRIIEKEEQALLIQQAVRLAGLKLNCDINGNSTGWPYIRAVKALDSAYKRIGYNSLSEMLRLISDIWSGEDDSIQGDMIEGMAIFFEQFPDFDRARFNFVMSKCKSSSICRSATAYYELMKQTNSTSASFSKVARASATFLQIVELYNKNLRRDRLVIKNI